MPLMPRPRRLPILVALVLAACSPVVNGTATSTTVTTVVDDASTTTATTVPAIVEEPPCASGSEPYVESGGAGLIERDNSDADVVAGIRWTSFPVCDRIVIEFAASSGAPAVSPPSVGPLFIRSAGVLRIQLDPVVSRTSILDQVIDGTLAKSAYVVRRTTNDLFIDLHLSAPASVRVSVASSPARVVVDLLAGGEPYSAPAIVTDDLVVVDPVGGNVIYPFTVNGYLRGGEDTMTVTVEAAGVLESRTGDVGQRGDAWGAFTVLIPDGPKGLGSILIGDRIPLTVDLS
ncbi:MAG: hypothetical protein WEA76_03190 [Acidimicrobiia bacterium]